MSVNLTTYIFTWNPANWPWDNFERQVAKSLSGKPINSRWSTGNNKRIKRGERFFLLRQGDLKRGIVASGRTVSDGYTGRHWDGSKREANYADIAFDTIISIPDRLSTKDLVKKVPEYNWMRVQASGVSIDAVLADRLESIWRDHLADLKSGIFLYPGEQSPLALSEGTPRSVLVDTFERNRKARKACIAHYGFKCVVCDFDFAETYGSIGENFIHVHHLKGLADIGKEHEVDPIKDLRPVCPNCHAMLHAESPPITTKKLRQIIRSNKK